MPRKTAIISAFPCSGKTFAARHPWSYLIRDLDLRDFCKPGTIPGIEPDPTEEELENYIQTIHDSIGLCDIIFVSAHLKVRTAMQKHRLKYVTEYPYPHTDACGQWLTRMEQSGYPKDAIQYYKDNWKKLVNSISWEPHGSNLFRLEAKAFMDLPYLYELAPAAVSGNVKATLLLFDETGEYLYLRHSDGKYWEASLPCNESDSTSMLESANAALRHISLLPADCKQIGNTERQIFKYIGSARVATDDRPTDVFACIVRDNIKMPDDIRFMPLNKVVSTAIGASYHINGSGFIQYFANQAYEILKPYFTNP